MIQKYFEEITDKRQQGKIKHNLLEMVVMTICAVIAGCEVWEDINYYCRVKEQIKSPIFSQDEYRMALTNYRKVDISTQDGKRKIIDTFINAIYVFDDHLKIIYNGKNSIGDGRCQAVANEGSN